MLATMSNPGTVDGMSELRPGQRAFNDVYAVYPHVADLLRGSEFDPFYDDERIESFYAQVALLVGQDLS